MFHRLKQFSTQNGYPYPWSWNMLRDLYLCMVALPILMLLLWFILPGDAERLPFQLLLTTPFPVATLVTLIVLITKARRQRTDAKQ